MSATAMKWAQKQSLGSCLDKAVLLWLAMRANDHGDGSQTCWHSQTTIAAGVDCADRSVRRSLLRLEREGLIERRPRYLKREQGGRTTDIIILLTENCVSAKLAEGGTYRTESPGVTGHRVRVIKRNNKNLSVRREPIRKEDISIVGFDETTFMVTYEVRTLQ